MADEKHLFIARDPDKKPGEIIPADKIPQPRMRAMHVPWCPTFRHTVFCAWVTIPFAGDYAIVCMTHNGCMHTRDSSVKQGEPYANPLFKSRK